MWNRTVEVEAFASPVERDQAMQQQVEEILARIDSQEAVERARSLMEAAHALTLRLKKAQGGLMKRAGQVLEEVRASSEKLETKLIDGEAVEPGLDELLRLEASHRLVTRANKRLAEQQIPRTEIDEMEKTAKFLITRAAALREEARVRLEKTAQLIAEAAEFEGNITFDPAQTVSGALTDRAVQMESQADNYRRWAAERAERHEKLVKEAGL